MLKRRHIGPAFERSPAEQVGDWASRNFLILLSAIVVAVVFWWMVNWVVDGLLNFLARGTSDTAERPFSSDAFGWVTFKIIGALVLIFFICQRRAK